MPFELSESLTGGAVPYREDAIPSGGNNLLAIGCEANRLNRSTVSPAQCATTGDRLWREGLTRLVLSKGLKTRETQTKGSD